MDFLGNISPLWIIPVVLIPPLIHLIFRKRPIRVDYSTLFLVKMIYQKTKKRMLFREMVIIALRSLLFLFLFLLLMRPVMKKKVNGTVAPVLKRVVIVLDDSASMHATRNGRSFWSVAVDRVATFLEGLSGDSVGMLYLCSGGREMVGGREELLKELRGLDATMLGVDLDRCIMDALKTARGRLGWKDMGVVVVSDFQKNSFSGKILNRIRYPVRFMKVSSSISNVAIVSGKVERRFETFGNKFRGEVKVRNFSGDRVAETVEVFVDGKKVSSAELPVESHSVGKRVLWWSREGRGGYFRIDDDDFDLDNRFFFVEGEGRDINILLVEGDPEPIPTAGGVYYLYTALQLWARHSGNIRVTTVLFDKFKKVRLDDYDVVFLSNVPSVSSYTAAELENWVKRGGVLFVVLGDMVRIDDYNGSGLLLGGILRGKVQDVSPEHPAGKVAFPLDDSVMEKLKSVDFTGYTLFENLPPGSKILMTLSNGVPLLIEKLLGRGRVVYYTSTVDDRWTDFPFKTSFLPLFYQLIIYLSSEGVSLEKRDYHTGEDVVFDADRKLQVEVIAPDGTRKVVRFHKIGRGFRGIYEKVPIPGVYRVLVDGKGVRSLDFAVNIPVGEMETIYADVPESGRKSFTTVSERDLSGVLLLLALFILILEGVVMKWL